MQPKYFIENTDNFPTLKKYSVKQSTNLFPGGTFHLSLMFNRTMQHNVTNANKSDCHLCRQSQMQPP